MTLRSRASLVLPALQILVLLAATSYLAGGMQGVVQFWAFSLLELAPATLLVSASMRGLIPSIALRMPLALTTVFLVGPAVYYLRRVIPLPGAIFDLGLSAGLWLTTLRRGAHREGLLLTSDPRRGGMALMSLLVAIAFCLAWVGFEAIGGQHATYLGLFPVDFANLANVVAQIKASPGLPLNVTVGTGHLKYHWLFFTVPAWLSDFAGMRMPASSALILCNLVVALSFCVALIGTISEALPETARPRIAMYAAGLVLFASSSAYATQILARILGGQGSGRNALLLSPLNSAINFGNNTLALTVAILVVPLLRIWNDTPRPAVAVLLSALLFGIIPLSATLFVPMALGVAVATVAGCVRRPLGLAVPAVVVGGSAMGLLHLANVVGKSSERFGLRFDDLAFLRTATLGMAPILVLALLGCGLARRWRPEWAFIAAAVATPTLLELTGGWAAASASSLSMKVGSLIAVLGGASASVALHEIWTRRYRAVQVLTVALVTVGILHSMAYLGQFAAYRLGVPTGRKVAIEVDYLRALRYVRDHTKSTAIVVDPVADQIGDTDMTLLISERLVWLPPPYVREVFRAASEYPEVLARSERFARWREARYRNEDLACAMAAEADVLVLRATVASPVWRQVAVFGDYRVYESALRT